MSDAAHSPAPEDNDTPKQDSPVDAKPYLDMIEQAERAFEPWQAACDNIDKQYASLERLRGVRVDRQFQMFWANLETLKTAIYSRSPQPVVVPRHKVRQDLPRKASEMLERCLITNADLEATHEQFKLARDNVALHARGVLWTRYKTRGEQYEYACTEHLNRRDFLHEPARKWDEVGWVARRSWLTKEQGEERFPGKAGLIRQATFKETENDTADEYKLLRKFAVWEIWHKGEGRVIWISPDVDEVLDIREPMLDLEGFFPCPKPAYATCEPDTLMPVPDMVFYKDQLDELNELTARISALCEALRLKGFYPAGAEDVSEAIETAIRANNNTALLVPIPNFAALMQGGGDPIVWLPVDMVAVVLKELLLQRRQVIEDIYEITGVSDLMRGSTEASETATAQQLKSQYGNVRVRGRQEEIVRLCRDTIRLEAEIMAEQFSPGTLLMMSQMELPQDEQIQQQMAVLQQQAQQMAATAQGVEPEQAQQAMAQFQSQIQKLAQTVTVEKVMAYLKNERLRPYLLDVETDSTIQPDEDAEKQRRTEFVGMLGQMLNQATEMVAAAPDSAEFVGEVIKFATAPFRVGRSLEGAIDDFVDKMVRRASQPPPPNPEAEARKAEMEMAQQKMQADMAAKQADAQAKQQDAQVRMAEAQAKMQADQQKAALEMEGLRQKLALERQTAELAMGQMEAKHAMEMEKLQADIAKINASAAAQAEAAQARAMNGGAGAN